MTLPAGVEESMRAIIAEEIAKAVPAIVEQVVEAIRKARGASDE